MLQTHFPESCLPSPVFAADQRADSAVKTILLHQLAVIEAKQAGTLTRLDTEFLHDLRVAARRTRSALGQLKGVFPDRVVHRYATGFAWLGQITGDPRDLDVYLLGFDDLKALLPLPLREDLEPLRSELERRREDAYRLLGQRLNSRAFRRLLDGWRAFLERPVARRPRAPNARVSIKAMADRRIHKLFRRALRQGRTIESDSPPERLHELRKTCKKLRYLMEFFQCLYTEEAIRSAIRQLKQLQDHLGAFQDVHAQLAWLRKLAEELGSSHAVATDTLLAMGALLGILEKRQEKLREEFRAHFREFDRKSNRTRYTDLFKPDVTGNAQAL
jgi:CHAD domain-containing protein